MPKIRCKKCGRFIKEKHTCPKKISRMIICGVCNQKRLHHANGLCNQCYTKQWKELNPNYQKKWQKDNPEKMKKYAEREYKESKEKIAIRNKKWREQNPEKHKENMLKWRKKNPERVRELKKESYHRNKEKIKIRSKLYRQGNKEKIRRRQTNWRKKNPERWNKFNKTYYQKNKKKVLMKQEKYYQKNKDKIKIYQRKFMQKRRENPQYRLYYLMSKHIHSAIKQNKASKHWEDLVGYTLEDLKKHLEKQFKKGMTWKNHGSYWHIDHRKPSSWFKFSTPQDPEFKECFALENLQPKRAEENIKKGNKYAEPTLNIWI